MKYLVAPLVFALASAACSAAADPSSDAAPDAKAVASSAQALAAADAAAPSFALEPGYYMAERGTSSGGPYIDGSESFVTQVTVAWPTITLAAPAGSDVASVGFDGTYDCAYYVVGLYDCKRRSGGETFLRVDSGGPVGRFDVYIDVDYGGERPFLQYSRVRD